MKTACLLLMMGSLVAQPPAPAILHVYAERKPTSNGPHNEFIVDGAKIANKIPFGRYFDYSVAPGKHVISSKTRSEAITIDVEPGSEHYFKVWYGVTGPFQFHYTLTEVEPVQGRSEMTHLKPIDPKDVASAR